MLQNTWRCEYYVKQIAQVLGVWRIPKLFNWLKCESKLKTIEKQGVKARFLARSTLEG